MNHVSVSPTDGNGPTQGQRKPRTKTLHCSRVSKWLLLLLLLLFLFFIIIIFFFAK